MTGKQKPASRPFPAVFSVLTGAVPERPTAALPVSDTMSRADSPPRVPRRMLRTIAFTGFAALIAAAALATALPARAQLGTIFSDPAPRPPGNVGRGQQVQQQQPDDDEEVPELPQGRVLPAPNRPPPG